MTKDVKEEKKTDILSMKEFLEKIPPGKTSLVSDLIKTSSYSGDSLNTPVLLLHCNHDDCNGLRYFEAVENGHFIEGFHINNIFLIYICKNCGKSSKLFALSARKMRSISQDKILKYGEHPPFGPPIPSKAITLIRPDRELLFTGYRAENQGMGIGAFVYYRRVVENQKNSIFDEIIKVTKKLNPDDPVIKDLENAKKKKQFSTAVEEIKQALPQILLIKGYNPLNLLHSALSEGLHNYDDDKCLKLATSIRTILFDFVERLALALKDDAKLNAAVKRLVGDEGDR